MGWEAERELASQEELIIPDPAEEMEVASENILEKAVGMSGYMPGNPDYVPNDFNEAYKVEDNDEVVERTKGAKKAWASKYDEDMRFECARNGAIYKVESEHSWLRDDRRWLFECADVVEQTNSLKCAWTKDTEVNEYDHPFYYECPANMYLSG